MALMGILTQGKAHGKFLRSYMTFFDRHPRHPEVEHLMDEQQQQGKDNIDIDSGQNVTLSYSLSRFMPSTFSLAGRPRLSAALLRACPPVNPDNVARLTYPPRKALTGRMKRIVDSGRLRVAGHFGTPPLAFLVPHKADGNALAKRSVDAETEGLGVWGFEVGLAQAIAREWSEAYNTTIDVDFSVVKGKRAIMTKMRSVTPLQVKPLETNPTDTEMDGHPSPSLSLFDFVFVCAVGRCGVWCGMHSRVCRPTQRI